MRKRFSLTLAGLLAGATLSMTAASPAAAQDECTSTDPVVAYVCRVIGDIEPGPWIQHYYNEVGEAWYRIYCLLWDPTC